MPQHTPKKKRAKASRKIAKLQREGVPREESIARGLKSAGLGRKRKKK